MGCSGPESGMASKCGSNYGTDKRATEHLLITYADYVLVGIVNGLGPGPGIGNIDGKSLYTLAFHPNIETSLEKVYDFFSNRYCVISAEEFCPIF